VRNNKNRLGAQQGEDSPATPGQIAPGLTFVVPTEFVELPSQGKLYPPNHPLYNQKTIEIKQMTSKEEDILTSESLIKNGVVLHRLIESVVVDKNIDPLSILTCDRNAIVVWSRIYGYGPEYNTKFQCPSCAKVEDVSFDLEEILENEEREELDFDDAEFSEDGNFVVTLPTTGWKVECRMANGYSEKQIASQQKLNKNNDSFASSQMKLIIKSIEGHQDKNIINQAIEVMPAKDAIHLRLEYQNLYPELELEHAFSCSKCGFSQEVEVPISADFFWIK
jgi:hypothetical protein